MNNEKQIELTEKQRAIIMARKAANRALTLGEFEEKMFTFNNQGAINTQKHRELYPAPIKDEKTGKMVDQCKGGRRYHAAGTDTKCPICKLIIDAHNEYMILQGDVFDLTGIPFQPLMSAVKITEGVVRMMANEPVVQDVVQDVKDEAK